MCNASKLDPALAMPQAQDMCGENMRKHDVHTTRHMYTVARFDHVDCRCVTVHLKWVPGEASPFLIVRPKDGRTRRNS